MSKCDNYTVKQIWNMYINSVKTVILSYAKKIKEMQ
jgi:hypothetical protein